MRIGDGLPQVTGIYTNDKRVSRVENLNNVQGINFGIFCGRVKRIINRKYDKKSNRKIKCQDYYKDSHKLSELVSSFTALFSRDFLLFASFLGCRAFHINSPFLDFITVYHIEIKKERGIE